MNFELAVIVLLLIIFALLFLLLIKFSKKVENPQNNEVGKINEQLEALLHKTMTINSKFMMIYYYLKKEEN